MFKEEIQETIHNKDYNSIEDIDPNSESEYGKETRNEAEVQQSLSDPRSFEGGIHETTQEAEDPHDDSESSSQSDTDMPLLVG